MSGFEFETREVRELSFDLARVPADVQPRAGAAVAKTAYDIEATAKVLVSVDTGNLMNSISSDVDRAALDAVIGPTAHYGGYVEEGTSRMAPQPYLGPAFDRHAPALQRALGDAGEDSLR